MSIYNELPTAFPWYDKKEKQHRFRENVEGTCGYKLISPNNGLLPFQLRVETGLARPTAMAIWSLCDEQVMDLTNNIPLLQAKTTEKGINAYYNGEAMQFKAGTRPATNLEIPEGTYYATLSFASGETYYSEVFTVVKDLSQYMRIEYSNSCDIDPIIYKDNSWKNILYLDTFVHVAEPEIEEDGERDGSDQLIPTYQKLTVKYRFSVTVPDFVKIAITSMQMHDNVAMTSSNAIRSGKIDRMTTASTVESGGAYSTVDVIMEQLLMMKQSCCEEMVILEQNPWNL